MNRKEYRGSIYSFELNGESIGSGGNGTVYEVSTVPSLGYPVVAKFFKANKVDREERYKRFRREIEKVSLLKDVKGILPIIDSCCPDKCPPERDTAWYLMPKADPFRVDHKRSIDGKIGDMLCLAEIIKELHSRGMYHRDIKPENILIYKGKVILSDFGLVWGFADERITEKAERIGPYKILPPEMEEVSLGQNMDFSPADVYLFAKVLWMYIKGDNIGFRGKYNRRDNQIYLDREKAKVLTFEPIHRLLERATEEYPEERITINECIENLKLQQQVIKEKDKESPFIRALIFEETSKRALQKIFPNVHIYEDKKQILNVLEDILQYSSVAIIDTTGKREILKGTRYIIERASENVWKLNIYMNRSITRQLYFNPVSMIHRVDNLEIILKLKPIPDDEMDSNNLRTIGSESFVNPTSSIKIGKPGK